MEIDWSKIETIEDEVNNSKANLLYLHAFSGSYRNKIGLRNYLKDYNFYALNMPGHGNSGFDSISQINYLYYCEIIVEYIKQKQLDNLILIGHSMGGGLAVLVNAYCADKIKKVILETPGSATFAPSDANKIIKLIPDTYQEMEEIGNLLFYDPITFFKSVNNYNRYLKNEFYNLSHKSYLKVMLEKQNLDSFSQAIAQSSTALIQPTYLILGEFDEIVDPKLCYQFYKDFKNVKTEVIAKTKHVPITEKSLEMYPKIKSFIEM